MKLANLTVPASAENQHATPLAFTSIIHAFIGYVATKKGIFIFPNPEIRLHVWEVFFLIVAGCAEQLPETLALLKTSEWWTNDAWRSEKMRLLPLGLESYGKKQGLVWHFTDTRYADTWAQEVDPETLEMMAMIASHQDGFFATS